jgi:L-malate glycosyltransferase
MANNKVVVLFLIDFLATREGVTGGTERQIIQIINRLDREKFKPILVCLQEFVKTPLWALINCEKYIYHVYSLRSFQGILKFISFIWFLKKHRINIVQTFFIDSIIFGVLAAKCAGIHNILSWRRDMGFWYDKTFLKILHFANRFTKRILVNSRSIKDFVIENEKIPAGRIDIIYNGIDISDIEAQKPISLAGEFDNIEKGERIVGIVGNFNREVKRFDLFIKAAAIVAAQCESVRFLVIGGGELEKEKKLKELAKKLKIADRLIFMGKRDNAIPYIKNFNIGVLTSDSEGFPNAVLEYMACSVASVATNVGGNQELIQNGKTGVLVPKGDPEALARAIIELLEDNDYREQLGRNAKACVSSKYSWEKKIREIENYYLSLFINSDE